MALLIGQEAEGSATAITLNGEIGEAIRCEVLASGTVEALHIKYSTKLSASVTSVRLAVVADAAGPVPKNTSSLAEGVKASPGEVFQVDVEGLSLAVTKGEFVWLVFEQIGTTGKVKPGTVNYASKSTAKQKTIAAMSWSATTSEAPMSLWATGTETGAAVKGKATGTLLLGGAAKGTAVQVVSGTATGVLLLTGTAKGSTAAVVSGKATGVLLLTGTAKGTAAQRVSGKATGTLLLGGTSKGIAAQVVSGKASGFLLLTGTAKAIKAAGAKKTIIFIFED